ncbi:MAG: hypothetical protein RQ885_00975 [Desulfurococcales archaeon]|nr:hypothetical protein [Desulfurococcales archaeon]
MYSNILSHYIHGVCQNATTTTTVSSLKRNRIRQYAEEIFNELTKNPSRRRSRSTGLGILSLLMLMRTP